MFYKIEETLINTKHITKIFITDVTSFIDNGRTIGGIPDGRGCEPPSVTICTPEGCMKWIRGYTNAYKTALALYDMLKGEQNGHDRS